MKQATTWFFLIVVTFALSACHCTSKKCHVGLPGTACTDCPKPAKALKPPRVEKECHPFVFPDRPVKFVTTQVVRKCCEIEDAVTEDGLCYQIEVCEVTYKGLYTDGSSKIWTEVSRNPIIKNPSSIGSQGTQHIRKGSIVGNRSNRPVNR